MDEKTLKLLGPPPFAVSDDQEVVNARGEHITGFKRRYLSDEARLELLHILADAFNREAGVE